MKELSLHILDLVQNSLSAGANNIKIFIDEDVNNNLLIISIEDDGRGMDSQTAEKVKDPFFTTRTTRKVGLGIPLLFAAAQRCDGDLHIESVFSKGTKVCVHFKYDHIDRAPLGNLWDTMAGLIACNGNIDFLYTHIFNTKEFEFSTAEIKNLLGDVPITSPEVIGWIKDYIEEGIKSLYGGVINEDNPGIGGNKEEDPGNTEC